MWESGVGILRSGGGATRLEEKGEGRRRMKRMGMLGNVTEGRVCVIFANYA